jgi:putative spermidine/putrescine transport system substrate-binding protein
MMMKHNITRRDFIKVTGSGLAVATIGLGTPFINSVLAAPKLSIVDWGPPMIDMQRKIVKKWNKAETIFTLHAGGAASILPKIKAAWPHPPYDIVDLWSPIFLSFIKEGWAATVTVEDCPNLKDIPESYISKDEKGNWKNIPRGSMSSFWGATEHCPIEITNIEDLLNPKLKGHVLWPNPTYSSNLQVVNLAMARGGSLHNVEPGWQFLKELAKSGNIGRVAANESDILTSLSTGETSVTFGTTSGFGAVRKAGVKVKYLTNTDESMKVFQYIQGWTVLESSKNKKLAFDFANFTINKENSELAHEMVSEMPLNRKAELEVKELKFSDEEIKRFVVVPDWDYTMKQLDSWNKLFEKKIVPLL